MQPVNADTVINLRLAEFSDYAMIREIATAAWQVAYRDILKPEFMAHELVREYSDEALQHQMTELNHRFWLLEVAGATVGFASFTVFEKTAIVHKLYLQPDTKGKGYGAALMNQVEKSVKEEACEFLELKVNRFNPAVGFYQKQGFEILREEDTVVGDGFLREDYAMQKALNF